MATFTDNPPVYDFDITDDFLQTLGGAVPTLSPELMTGDDKFASMNNNYDDSNMINLNSYNGFNDMAQSSSDLFANDQTSQYVMAPIPDSLNEVQYNGNTQDFSNIPQVIEDSPISSTNSHSSTNGLTPVSQHSGSSIYTSPETVHVKDEISEGLLLKKETISKATSSQAKITSDKVTKPGKKDRCSHNMIEKKYRTNINSKILALRDAVPSLRIATGDSKNLSIADLEGLSPASKLNKASVLTKATEYIKHLEKKNDILKRQNMELQRIIQLANSGRIQQQQQQQQHIQHQQQQHMQVQHPMQQQGFGFMPGAHDQNYNTTIVMPQQANYGGNNVYGNYQMPPQQNGLSNGQKVLLGGLATVMGSAVFSGGDGDFKGLSALPFASMLPKAVLHPSPMTLQAFHLIRILVLMSAIANILYPSIVNSLFSNPKGSKSPTSALNIYKSYFLVNFGLRLPHDVTEDKRSEIISLILGNTPGSFLQLFTAYAYLSSAQMNYENCLLTLIVGKMLIVKYPFLSSAFDYNMSTKASLLINLEYNGDDVQLKNLNSLFKRVDGVSVFGSQSLFKRLINVFEREPISQGCEEQGANNLKYVEFYQNQQNNLFGILFAWRILELTNELNISYLTLVLAGEKIDEENTNAEDERSIVALTELISTVVQSCKNHKLIKYFNLFRAVIIPETANELKENIEDDIDRCLENFKTIMEGQELTDTATISSDEEEVEEVVEDNEEEDDDEDLLTATEIQISTQSPLSLSSQSKLINSLNLVSEEEFIILTCSSILMYHNVNAEQAKKLLRHLSDLENSVTLSFLSFTSILNVVVRFASEKCEHDSILDQLIRLCRVWISDETKKYSLDSTTRSNLADLIVKKGLILNGCNETELDE